MEWIQQFDEAIVLWVRQYMTCPFLDVVMKTISDLGNHGMIWIGIVVIFLFMGKGKKENWRIWAIVLGSSLALSAFVTNVLLKPFAARIRPYDMLLLEIIVPPLNDFSFPSGHTTAAFASACVIWHINHRWGVITFLFGGIMAFSRIYLAVHYPTDVLVGAGIGVLSAWFVLHIFEKTKMIAKKKS